MITEKYKYYANDFDSYNVYHIEDEKRTFMATTDTAEKADLITKSLNIFSSLMNVPGGEPGQGIKSLLEINVDTNEGLLLFAALIRLSVLEPYCHMQPDTLIKELTQSAKELFDRDLVNPYEGRKAILIKGSVNGVPQWRFVLKGANGETVADGEYYTRKRSALDTIEKHFSHFEVVEDCDLKNG